MSNVRTSMLIHYPHTTLTPVRCVLYRRGELPDTRDDEVTRVVGSYQ